MGLGLFDVFKLKSVTKQLEKKYGHMHIHSLKSGDRLEMRYGKLTIRHDGADRLYRSEDIRKISIFTNDQGLFENDMVLTVFLDDSIFLIHAEQELFHTCLFDTFGKEMDINFKQMAKAMTCVENAEFVIYDSD